MFAATQINALAYDAPDDLDQVVEEAEKTLFNVTEKRVSSSFRKMDELVSDAYEEISRPRQPEGQDGRRSHGLQGRR